jgi:acetyl-CoA C-acetyltransferase
VSIQSLNGRYAIAGVGEAGMGRAQPGDTALSLQCEAARRAILDAGLKPTDIDAVFAHWDDRAAGLLVAVELANYAADLSAEAAK